MVVLITGASGGLGRVLGATLLREGMTVYGTARAPDGLDAPFPLLAMEVTDAASVAGCVEEVLRREGRIDVVVNLSLIHISEPTRLRRISYAVFCLKKKKKK